MAIDPKPYAKNYSDEGFWKVMKKCAAKIPGAKRVLVLFYVMKDKNTPVWAKALIVAALGYVICPVDLIPDVVPFAGWTDDAGVIGSTLVAVRAFIESVHEEMAQQAIDELLS